MKTRVLHTSFWDDGFVSTLSPEGKLLFCYLLTNSRINICGAYELPDRKICYDLGISRKQLDAEKLILQKGGKAVFRNGWVRIPNVDKYNSYLGPKNVSAREKEVRLAPKELLDTSIDTSMDTPPIGYGYLPEIRNQKSEIRNQELGECEREENEMRSRWKEHVGTELRSKIRENLASYRKLSDLLGTRLPEVLMAVRMIRSDRYAGRNLQISLVNYAGLEKRLEEVEAYMAGKVDSKITNSSSVII